MNKCIIVFLFFASFLIARSDPPTWSVNPVNYQFNANVTALLSINDTVSASSSDMLAAFVGNEVRGVTSPLQVGGNYYYFLTVFSNIAQGETLTFQCYKSNADAVGSVDEILLFVSNNIVGNPDTPFELNGYLQNYDRAPTVQNIPDQLIFVGESFQSFDLDDYLTEYNNDGILWSVSGNSQLNVSIGNGNIVTITPAQNFIGKENLVFRATDNTANSYFDTDTATFTVRPIDVPPFVNAIPNQTIRIGGAFSNISLNNYLTSVDDDSVEWSYYFHPSQQTEHKPSWSINPTNFLNSMTVTAEVISLGQTTVGNGNLLAAFSGNQIRGVIYPINVLGKWLYFLTVYANTDGEEISFRFYDTLARRSFPVQEKIIFQSNDIVGEPVNPFSMHAGNFVISISNSSLASFAMLNRYWLGTDTVTFIATDKNTVNHFSDSVDVALTSEFFAFSANPVLLEFGFVAQGSGMQDSIYITNYNEATIHIDSIFSTNSEFVVASNDGLDITEGATKVFVVTFTPTSSNQRTGLIIFTHSAASSPDTVVVSGYGFGKFRTFSHVVSDFSAKAVKLKYKKGKIVTPPNMMTAVEGTFNKQVSKTLFKKGRTFLGIERIDSAKEYAWITLKKASELAKGMLGEHTGQGYPLDYFRDPIRSTKKKLKKSVKFETKLNNPAIAQGILFKLNLLASDSGVTPRGLGELVLDTTIQLAGRQMQGLTLNEIANYYDSIMTFWKKFGIDTTADYEQLRSFAINVLERINDGFYSTIDTSVLEKNYDVDSVAIVSGNASSGGKKDAYAIKLTKGKSVNEISIVKQVVNARETALIFSDENSLPEHFVLYQNYPNPFNPTTAISFQLSAVSEVTLKVYDILGREVATLLNNEAMEGGEHEVEFEASKLSSGVYFYRLTSTGESKTFVDVKKMILMK
jgi:hypothetical protein